MITERLTLKVYHDICSVHLTQYRSITALLPTTVDLGAVIYCPSDDQLEHFVTVARLTCDEVHSIGWLGSEGEGGEVMQDGWTRFNSGDVFNRTFSLCEVRSWDYASWLSQANHVFSRFSITSNFENYVPIDNVIFELNILGTPEEPPTGFLFLCPESDFQAGPSSFEWPECPAYWSLDPLAAEHLSADKAAQLGFPPIQVTTKVAGYTCDASVYAGLCQFHQAKGFDPESQEVARYLGITLYDLCDEINVPFAHGK
ncbi:hypothetical protein B0H19DRAFT_693080 [Mycena capillaripes]|nr:hypothetical protein B0H19DRAFT_693080 [Mycena capillaripes]